MELKEIFEKFDDMVDHNLPVAQIEAFLRGAAADYDIDHEEDRRGRCALYNELGGFYRHYSMVPEGQDAFRKAMALIDDKTSFDYATTLLNIAGLKRVNKEYDDALELFRETIRLYDLHPDADPYLYAGCYNNMALVHMNLEDFKTAIEEITRALEIVRSIPNHRYDIAVSLQNLGYCQLCTGDKKAAIETLKEAVEIALERSGPDGELTIACQGLLKIAQEAVSNDGT